MGLRAVPGHYLNKAHGSFTAVTEFKRWWNLERLSGTPDRRQSRTFFYLKVSRSRLSNKEFSIVKMAIADRKLDVFDCHNVDFGNRKVNVIFGNRKRKLVRKFAFTIAAYPVCVGLVTFSTSKICTGSANVISNFLTGECAEKEAEYDAMTFPPPGMERPRCNGDGTYASYQYAGSQ